MSDKNLRDHGFGPSGEPFGKPTWEKAKGSPPCPNCGADLCSVSVPVKHPLLKGGEGTSTYLGCPACPFASPAVMTAGKV
jgi:hypothetical protein